LGGIEVLTLMRIGHNLAQEDHFSGDIGPSEAFHKRPKVDRGRLVFLDLG
jgi:hypothetical protein